MSNILVQTKIQSLVFKKYQNVVAVSHYKNDVLINTFYLNAQLFKNIQLTLMHFRDALTRIKAYHDKQLARLFPELTPVKIKNSPTVNTDDKESTKDYTHVVTKVGEVDKGVVDSVGDALSLYDFFSDEFDEVGLYEHPAALTQPEPINQKSFIDDDIPPSFFESGIFARAE